MSAVKKRRRGATRIGRRGIDLIASFEGGRSADGMFRPYKDPVGVWTIGFGHTRGVSRNSKPLTLSQAKALLRKDLDEIYTPPVVEAAKRAGIRLYQRELDALVSAVYNLGPGILGSQRTLGAALRTRNRRKIADALLAYTWAGGKQLPGLVRRRAAERRLFLTGRA